jgi:hypothetical protein
MSEREKTVTLVIRKDTEEQWEAYNPTLKAGEYGLNQTNGRVKRGDGQTAWQELAYEDDGINSTIAELWEEQSGLDMRLVVVEATLPLKADSAAVNDELGRKVDKQEGQGLSDKNFRQEDYDALQTLIIETGKKVDKITGKGLSDKNFTEAYKEAIDRLVEEIKTKVAKVAGYGLSANDFSNFYKGLLDGLGGALAQKVTIIEGKGLSTLDFTQYLKNKYDQAALEVLTAVQKEPGKGLSEENYTAADKDIIKGIPGELAKKQDKLTFDEAPNPTSSNPVTSRGIAAGLAARQPQADELNYAVGAFRDKTGDITIPVGGRIYARNSTTQEEAELISEGREGQKKYIVVGEKRNDGTHYPHEIILESGGAGVFLETDDPANALLTVKNQTEILEEVGEVEAAAAAAQATADEAKAIAESALHLRGVLMFGADTVASMESIPESRLSAGDACGVQETNQTYEWDAAQEAWVAQPHGEDAVGDQWNMNSWYGVWQNQTFTGNATASIVCITTEPLYWALTVSESTPVGGDLGINGDHIDIKLQSAPGEITEDTTKFAGGFGAKFSGFFQAVLAKINGILSLIKGCQDEEAALEARLDSEAGTRGDADATLQTNIDTEQAARIDADATLQTNINNEAGTRGDADEALQTNIDTEQAARIGADATLQTNIDTEEAARIGADATLQTNIDTEADAREAALALKLDKGAVGAGYTPEGTLEINGVTGETQMNDAEEISLYTHHLKIRVMNGSTFVIWFGLELFLNENTPFTAATFWSWLADQGYTSEANSKPINGRFTTDGSSSLDAGAVWINAGATQIMITTIASTGTAVQTIALSGKTTDVSDFVKEAPFNIAAHRHGFSIEDMSGGFVGVYAPQVLQAVE